MTFPLNCFFLFFSPVLALIFTETRLMWREVVFGFSLEDDVEKLFFSLRSSYCIWHSPLNCLAPSVTVSPVQVILLFDPVLSCLLCCLPLLFVFSGPGQHWTCLVTIKHPGYLVGPSWGIFELWAQKTRKWTLTRWLFTPLTPLASPKQWQVLDQVLFITTVIKEKLWDPKFIWFIFTDAEVMINADQVPHFCYGRFNFYENLELCGLCKAVVFFFGPFLYFVFSFLLTECNALSLCGTKRSDSA